MSVIIDQRTTALGLRLPHPSNQLDADVLRLINALQAIDSACAAGFISAGEREKLATIAAGATVNATDDQLRARSSHTGTQAISTITNLQAVLDDLQTSINGKQAALVSGINIKTVGGQSLLGAGNVTVQQWARSTSTTAHDNADLADGTRYDVESGTGRYLPNAPAIGFRVALIDGANLFGAGTWVLRRRNANHLINNRAEDCVFNFNAGIVSVEYTANNRWALA